MKTPILTAIGITSILVIIVSCGQPVGQPAGGQPLAAPTPPNGWKQKVNNTVIKRVSLADLYTCAYTEGRNVRCRSDSIDCSATVSFTDGSADETWQDYCGLDNYLIFDDGSFSYFYGTKQ